MNERLCFPYYNMNELKNIAISDIELIYGRLADDLSKEIFVNRLLFSITSDFRYIRNIVRELNVWIELEHIISQKKIYIYGAGVRGIRLPLLFPEYNWCGYIDQNKKDKVYNDLPLYRVENNDLFNEENSIILITNLKEYDKIRKKLIEIGINKDHIIVLEEYYQKAAEKMYFDLECVERERVKNKIFVDAGCFDGNDTIKFFRWMGNIPARSIAFELDIYNYETCKKNLENLTHVKLYNMGLSERTGELRITEGKGVETSLSKEGNSNVMITSLDNIIQNDEIGYIKMDIEGSEKDAISGSTRIIREQHPMIAVSLYHKREDIWEIPSLILKLDSSYKFFLRHYSLSIAETVLYAV